MKDGPLVDKPLDSGVGGFPISFRDKVTGNKKPLPPKEKEESFEG